jgi:DNA-binding response OmpR family regulator
MKMLLVEDDQGAAELLKSILIHHHYIVDLAMDGETGLSLAQMFAYDIILLDVMLPKLDGLMFCRQVRAQKIDTSILLLTVLDSSTSKVIGLDAGADDYVVKPFDTNELLARIRALVRRKSKARSSVIEAGNVRLDSTSSKVTCNGQLLHLTAKEYALLELFLQNSHRIFSQQLLLDYLWSSEQVPLTNTVRAHIKTLRQKLRQAGGDELIETVHGMGYRLKSGQDKVNLTDAVELDFQPTEVDAIIVERSQPPISSSVLRDIWKRFKPKYSDRVTVLEENITALLAGTLTEEQVQQAQASAHVLIGSLGSFGFTEASRLCREIEQIFRAGVKQSQAEVERLSQLVVALRQELQQPVATEASAVAAKRCLWQRFAANIKEQPQLLIINNDAQLSQQLINEAEICGIEALVATNLTEVREATARKCPNVVLLDLCFSNSIESGLELLAELTTNNWALPVLVFNAVEDFATRLKVARLGGQFFLPKPLLPTIVLAAVIQVLQQSDIVHAKIMIVDDDPQMLDILGTLLEPWGFELTLLDNAQRFWDTLNAFNPDLLILDVEMSLSGIDLCKLVRNDLYWNHLPVLFLSVHKDAQTLNRVFSVGADDYLTKPIVGPELIARIINRLERTHISNTANSITR